MVISLSFACFLLPFSSFEGLAESVDCAIHLHKEVLLVFALGRVMGPVRDVKEDRHRGPVLAPGSPSLE